MKRTIALIFLDVLIVGLVCTFSACGRYARVPGEQSFVSMLPTMTPVTTAMTTPTPTVLSGIDANVAVGDIVKLGAYEQDNNTSNGQEEIDWIVLDKKDGKALLISKYGLDCQPYNTTSAEVIWESCTLRSWLNTTFYNSAFTTSQQTSIATTTITVLDASYEAVHGIYITDKVFLLSKDEAKQYFNSADTRKVTATAYARAQGVWRSTGGCSYWWLRSPRIKSSISGYYVYDFYSSVDVDGSGIIRDNGSAVYQDGHAVRPALWINLET